VIVIGGAYMARERRQEPERFARLAAVAPRLAKLLGRVG